MREPPTAARPRIAATTLGCRVNQDELDCLRASFVDAGWEAVRFDAEAEVYLINTCTVTGFADAESRKVIRRAVRRKPEGGLVVVTGCYAQRAPEALRDGCGADLVLGNTEKARLFAEVSRLRADRRLAGDIWVSAAPRTTRFLRHGASAGPRTRATLKVQDGCDERCTYCVIPQVRGPSVSRELGKVLDEARRLAARGFREIALTGVNTGSYGEERGGGPRLAALVRALDALGLDARFRLNSLEPASVSDTLLDAVAASPSFCPHFHVPLQHGDARVLRRMGRSYDATGYAAVTERIVVRFPEAGIGADVMVGFPGETVEEFERCRAFVASLPLTYLHVFSYAPRDGTPAARMPGQVPASVKKERSRRLHALDAELRRAHAARLAGRTLRVLVETARGERGGLCGLTPCYLRVELDTGPDEPAPNAFVDARVLPLADGTRVPRARCRRVRAPGARARANPDLRR